MILRNPTILRFVISVFLFFITLSGAHARSKVSGTFEWDYGHFEAEESGVEVSGASHFAQKYSLFYEQNGRLLNGRAGHYDLALGGEFFDVNTEVTKNAVKTNINIDNAKALYRGELLFAPGGLPFRFYVYSRDMRETIFEHNNMFFNSGNFDEVTIKTPKVNILDPQIIGDVSDGTTVVSGVSFVLGIRNGSYLGKYRDTLAHLPRLFIDYKEMYVKDLKSLTPEHFKDQELAFVSLNKKHNWIHYRSYRHVDELNPAKEESIKIYLLGNVDHRLVREWVNLTNWIQISTDGSYTTELNPLATVGTENTYQLNLFAKTIRSNWKSSIYSTFRRWERTVELDRTLQVPFFANGDLNRNISWHLRLIGAREKDNRPFALVNQVVDDDNLYAQASFDLNKTSKFILSPSLEAELKEGNLVGDGAAVRLGIDVSSNRRIIEKYDFFASFDFAYFEGKPSSLLLNDVDFWETEWQLNIAKQVTRQFRAGFESGFVYGEGTMFDSITDYITPTSNKNIVALKSLNLQIQDKTSRINFMWFTEYISTSRLKNRIEIGVEILKIDQVDSDQYFLLHRLDYTQQAYSFRMLNEIIVGDNLDYVFSANNSKVPLAGSSFDGFTGTSESRFQYYLNKNWTGSGELCIDWVDSDNSVEGGYRVEVGQDLEYKKFYVGSRFRKLFDVEEYFNYEITDLDNGVTFQFLMLALVGNYYPTSWSRLGAKIRTQHDLELNYSETGFGLYADLDFTKLDVSVEYEIGMRADDDLGTVLERDEQRWQVNIKKTF